MHSDGCNGSQSVATLYYVDLDDRKTKIIFIHSLFSSDKHEKTLVIRRQIYERFSLNNRICLKYA